VAAHAKAGLWSSVQRALESTSSGGQSGAFVAQKVNNLLARLSGYPAWHWSSVRDWEEALRHQIQVARPGIAFIRGAGISFEPHMAMLRLGPGVPWIANYHDPFPISLYPEPYRGRRVSFVSLRQEALHRRIVMEATALTFPSKRLLEWVLRDELERYRDKAFVLPHVAADIGISVTESRRSKLPILSPDDFNLIHTGTLIANRGADLMIQAFLDFLDEAPEDRQNAKLVLVGGVHNSHLGSPIWTRALKHPNIIIVPERVQYAEALCLGKQATAMIVIEAASEASPFFPGKLTDCLVFRKPLVAVTPRESVITDLLGPDYPLLAEPGQSEGLVAALRHLFVYWRDKRLCELVPPSSLAEAISNNAVATQFDAIVSWCLA
jgi:glycosyltransferase involved in cell wall biosynthesis